MSASLQLVELSAGYGRTPVLDRVSVDVAPGEFVALVGPSGCGKTTALKVIAGLVAPSSGEVRFDGRTANPVPAERRGAAMVFQKPLLFPHLTAAENVAFGLKMRRVAPDETRRRVDEALSLVQLDGLGSRKPKELSGGQEQRVALARALVTEPRVLLLDEPFSALDETLRVEMRSLVRDIQRRLRTTTVFVTHDQREAAALADRIALLVDGRIRQIGPPRDFYTAPVGPDVARFFGWTIVQGRAFRAERARVVPRSEAADETVHRVHATVLECVDLGTRVRFTVRLDSGEIFDIEQASGNARDEVYVEIPSDGLVSFGHE